MNQYGRRGDAAIAQRFRQISKAMACLVVALGFVGFCGWVFHLPALTAIRPTFAAMKFNVAVLFLCLGIALWITDIGEGRQSRRVLGLLIAIVAGLTLAERAFDIDIGIDQFFIRDTHTAIHPGRMSVATATCFLLLGLGVLPTARKRMRRLQRHGVMVCLAISLTALCGYVYGAASFYSMEPFGTMSLHTAAAFVAACMAYFFAHLKDGIMFVAVSDADAGLLLRRLIPMIFIVPIVLGWLTLAGERVRLYKAPFGTSLLVLGSIVCLTALTTMISRSLYRVEREREWVEEALKKSEEKFLKAFRGSPVVLAITSAKDHRYLDVSESFEQWTGWRRDEVIGRTPFDIGIWVNPAERSEFVRQLQAEGAIRNVEFRYRRKDGVEMVGLGSGELIQIGNEQCVIFAFADITERKRAEEALSGMTQKLVEAQEQERSRIGRELHDDVGQRLAMLSIALGQLKNRNNFPSEIRDRMQELKQMASDMATGIHALSHELHSSMMEHLGLVSGMRGWCEEYGKQHTLQIDFKSDDVPPLRQEISLCLFRVLQEALHNAAKHSGEKRIEVQLLEKSGEIHLIVSDSGKGFDMEAARQKRGLGLTSMQERVRLIGGTVVIESKPLGGTVVHVCVPFKTERRAKSASG